MSSTNINWYDAIPKQYKGGSTKKYKAYQQIKIDVPCRMLICGAGGSGKTNTLMNIIRAMNAWDKYILVAKQPDQPIYNFLRDLLGTKLTIYENMDEFPSLDEFDGKVQTLVIFDDMLCEDKKTQTKIANIYIRARHKLVSAFYLSQAYFQTAGLIRKNCDIIVITKINTKRDLTYIVREYSLTEMTDDELMALYNKIKSAGFGNYLTVDTNSNDPKYKFRFNLEPIEST